MVNLRQAGLRGLVRVIGTEYPHLKVTQVDVDEQTDPELVARQLMAASDEDETAWRDGEWYVARMCPAPLRAGGPAHHRRGVRSRRRPVAGPHPG